MPTVIVLIIVDARVGLLIILNEMKNLLKTTALTF